MRKYDEDMYQKLANKVHKVFVFKRVTVTFFSFGTLCKNLHGFQGENETE